MFSTVTGATNYTIEFDTLPSFATVGFINSTTSPAGLVARAPRTFYLRVRASNGAINSQSALPSNVEAIRVIADTTSGADQGSAVALGAGVFDSLNILPSSDEDWFELNLSVGDGLSAWVYARVLNPASELDPDLEFRSPMSHRTETSARN